ncbi:alpha/beta hydrolase [Nocardia higoensis]|uniref:Alpha/beta hydrolase n=1 Tax=Nocardia higoensis TaxID=228599 RepID=A0ABS0D893_9NOCA|nr:alpha/beta hydrolase [Nocardia higoensis]MBF6354696.1 alpha/beta hydrolase [Nocardia higoensis]
MTAIPRRAGRGGAAPVRTAIGELLTIGSHELHIRQDGPADAEPLLLVHGFMESLHWWDRLTPLLSDTYRVIRVDLAGYGCTRAATGFDASSQAALLEAALDSLELSDLTAVGHSWGADHVLSLAERSDRVARIVVIGQAPDCSDLPIPAIARLLGFEAMDPIVALAHRLVPEPVFRRIIAHAFAEGFDLTTLDNPAQLYADYKAMSPRMFRAAALDRPKALTLRPLDARVRELARPTLVIHGQRDRMFDCARAIARYAAVGARTEVIPDAGHSPQVETPHHVAALIRDFCGGLPLKMTSSITEGDFEI